MSSEVETSLAVLISEILDFAQNDSPEISIVAHIHGRADFHMVVK